MPKTKRTKPSLIPVSQKTEVVPEDLQKQFAAAEACATALALFDQGYYSPKHAKYVEPTAAFLAKLHEQTVDQALAHPQAHMIPALNAELKKRKEEKNATTN